MPGTCTYESELRIFLCGFFFLLSAAMEAIYQAEKMAHKHVTQTKRGRIVWILRFATHVIVAFLYF